MITASTLRRRMPRHYGRISDARVNAMLGAMAHMLEIGHIDSEHGVDQLHLRRASHEWLDLWGVDYYSIPRRDPTELDETYAWRIIVETIRQRPQARALELIVEQTRRTTIQIRDLWPSVLIADQFDPLPDGHLHIADTHFLHNADTMDSLGTCSMGVPYLPASFGVWVQTQAATAFVSDGQTPAHNPTQAEVLATEPLLLLGDQFDPNTLHRADGEPVNISVQPVGAMEEEVLASPPPIQPDIFGAAPANIRNATAPASTDEVMQVIHRHRAAGTRPTMMGVTPHPLPEIMRVDDSGGLIIASGFGAHENLILQSPDTTTWLVMIAAETGQMGTVREPLGQAVTPRVLTSPDGTLYNVIIDNAGSVSTVAA